jgi:hypothetical protein
MSDEMDQHDAPCQWERLEAVAMRGDHEFLVRSCAGMHYADVNACITYRVHEVRALTAGGWVPADQHPPAEAVAMQLVLRTLLPYRFRSAPGA